MKKILLSIAFLSVAYLANSQSTVAFWSFNSLSNDATTSTGSILPEIGTASISTIGGTTNSFASGTASDPNSTDNSGFQTTTYPSASSNPKTAGIEFSINTTGYSNLILSFWQRLSNTAANTWVLQYTTDITSSTVTWVDAETFTFVPQPSGTGDTWYLRSKDFSSVTALNNNPNAAFRVVSDFDPISGDYLAARSTSTYGGGTARFDLIELVEAAPIAKINATDNFVIVDESANTIQVPIQIVNGSTSPSRVAFALSSYSDAELDVDFTWVNDTLDIPANTTGTVNFPITILDDNISERAERIILKIIGGVNINFSTSENYQIIYIKDNDYQAPTPTNELNMSLLTSFSNGLAGDNSAEIVAYDSTNYRLYIANSVAAKLDIVDFSNPSVPVILNSIDISTYGNINSVCVYNGTVAMAIENTQAQENGFVVFLNADGTFISQVTVGAMPDMITFNKNQTKILTANEGEPNDDYSLDPEGSVSIVDLTAGYAALTNANVTTIGFTAYNGMESDLIAQGIRIFSSSASVAQDLEPEYITISDDNLKAFVAIQENNALAVIDIASATIDTIYALGYSDYSTGNGMDASDKNGQVLIASAPVKGAYMPDAIAFAKIAGQGYVFSANEGDSREFGSVVDAERIKDLNLDETIFPDQHILMNDNLFGRLNGLTYSGDTDNDGDLDEIHVMGGRSFSIWNASNGQLVFDSKDLIEQITSVHPATAPFFNASNSTGNATLKNRSDDKGPEPEGVTTAVIAGNTYLFVSLERVGGVLTFNVNDPANPVYVGYYNNRTLAGSGPDLGAEGIIHISATASPNGNELVILANEVSSTLSVYQINTCAELAGAVIEAIETELCEGETASLSFTPEAGTTFEWIKNTTSLPTETNTSLTVSESGMYSIAVENATYACSAVSNTIEINVNANPIVNLGNDITGCENISPVTLNAGNFATYNWSTGATTPTIQVSSTGNYSVTVTNAANCSASDVIQVTIENCAGIEAISLNTINVYPNPSSDFIQVDLSELDQLMNIQLVDLQGKTVLNSTIQGGKNLQIDIRDLKVGSYFLRIQGENVNQNHHILKK